MAKVEARVMAECEEEAMREYLAHHKTGSEDADTLSLELESIITTKTKRPGGTILVSVSVISRKPWNSENYCFTLQTAGRTVTRRSANSHPML
jgi:hypothetical protein